MRAARVAEATIKKGGTEAKKKTATGAFAFILVLSLGPFLFFWGTQLACFNGLICCVECIRGSLWGAFISPSHSHSYLCLESRLGKICHFTP
jgi:hypothetical protein